jgi:RNA polymerase sigma-70 factor (ECF subfamily)
MAKNPAQFDLDALQRGEAQAIQDWFETCSDALYAFAFFRVGKDESRATDVVQETFLEAMKRMSSYDSQRGSMVAWLTTLSRNHITRVMREAGLRAADEQKQRHDRELRRVYEQIAREPLPSEVLAKQETRDLVNETLSTMPGNYRTVLTLYYHRGLSLTEIAKRARKSQGAIKVLLHRARAAFKEAFLRLSQSPLEERGLL